jgi:hypothetical protein
MAKCIYILFTFSLLQMSPLKALMATFAYGDREIQHFNRNILWAQLRLVEEVLLFGDAFL